VAITAAASVGIGRADARRAPCKRGHDRRGAEAGGRRKEVPGVVAMAATDKGVLYEGAFGTRDLATGPAMTLDTSSASPR